MIGADFPAAIDHSLVTLINGARSQRPAEIKSAAVEGNSGKPKAPPELQKERDNPRVSLAQPKRGNPCGHCTRWETRRSRRGKTATPRMVEVTGTRREPHDRCRHRVIVARLRTSWLVKQRNRTAESANDDAHRGTMRSAMTGPLSDTLLSDEQFKFACSRLRSEQISRGGCGFQCTRLQAVAEAQNRIKRIKLSGTSGGRRS